MSTLNRYYPAIQGEYEDEDEFEYEYEYELEGEDEYEYEYEDEDESEDEAFLGALGGLARSFLGEGEDEFEFEFEAEAEAEMEDEFEDELEDELEEEAEGFVNPVRRIYRDAELMAHLAKQAAATESESEAEQFIGALVPLAARLIPRAAPVVSRNATTLMRGASRVVRRLRRNPQTRRLVAGLPVVLQRTAQSLADQAAAGQPIDADRVASTLDTMAGRVLQGPGAPRALRAVNVFNRRWHRRRGARAGRARYQPGYGAAVAARPVRLARRRPVRSSYRRPAYRRVARRGRRR